MTPDPLTLWHVALVRPDGITRRRLLMDRAAVDALLELVKGEGEVHVWTARAEWTEEA